jgi:hypothetical protein
MHNIIIESEGEEPVVDDQPIDHQGPLSQLDQLSVKFIALSRDAPSRDVIHTGSYSTS